MTAIIAQHFETREAIRIGIRGPVIESVMRIELPPEELAQLPIVAPGLLDLQVNGFNGIWFSSEHLTVEAVENVIDAYLRHGITRCLPTLITNSCEAIEHGLATLRAARAKSDVVRRVVCGYHIEGPFISAIEGPRGAHPLQHVRPASHSEFQRWQQVAGGLVKLVTLAPEVPGAIDFIRAVSKSTVVSIGHTAASSEQIRAAIDAGARLGTHLGNGCAGMVPRHDNVFWPQLADDRLMCSVIADGWHVPSPMLNCIVRCKSMDRLILTCDVSGFGGCKPGRYSTGDVSVDVLPDGRIVVAGQTQYLAGSAATTGECVTHLMNSCGVSLPDAWRCASERPARLLGLPVSDLKEGSPAYLTLFRLEPSASGVQYRPVGAISGVA